MLIAPELSSLSASKLSSLQAFQPQSFRAFEPSSVLASEPPGLSPPQEQATDGFKWTGPGRHPTRVFQKKGLHNMVEDSCG